MVCCANLKQEYSRKACFPLLEMSMFYLFGLFLLPLLHLCYILTAVDLFIKSYHDHRAINLLYKKYSNISEIPYKPSNTFKLFLKPVINA